MVKVNFGLIRYLEEEDFRVLIALEMCMRNHDVAPTVLIERIAQLPHGGARKRLNHLLKYKVIHHETLMYDGFAMKYCAYDYLAVRTLTKRGTLAGVGSRVGCGKESDILSVIDPNGNEAIMKLQRLGRCSFRSVARNRDYKGNMKERRGASWFFLSRLAATKEYAFMKMLYDEGFPVPKPIDHNRHAVVMERVNGTLLNNIQDMSGMAQKVYERILSLMVKLAEHGLIHGDFNEFNTFVTDEFRIVIIDFPQMVSTDHLNASDLFDRDVNNLAAFFKRRHKIEKTYFPKLDTDVERTARFDQQLAASGAFTKKQQKELEAMMEMEDEEEEEEEEDEEEDLETKAAAAATNLLALKGPTTTTAAAAEEEDGDAEVPEGAEGDAPAPPAAASSSARPLTTEVATDDAPPSTGTAPTIALLAARATAQAVKPAPPPMKNGGDDDDDGQGNDSAHGSSSDAEAPEPEQSVAAPSIASTAATIAKRMLQKRRAENPNYAPGGESGVNGTHVWDRTKAKGRHNENVEFARTMHRNSMKGKANRRIRREIQNGDHPQTIHDL